MVASNEGSHYIIAASSTGEVEKRDIEVVKEIDLRITDVRKPSSLACGQAFNVTFSVQNMKGAPLDVTAKTAVSDQIGPVQDQSFSLDPSEFRTVAVQSSVVKECKPGSEFVDIVVNDQRVHAQFSVSQGGLAAALNGISSLLDRMLESLKILIENLLNRTGNVP